MNTKLAAMLMLTIVVLSGCQGTVTLDLPGADSVSSDASTPIQAAQPASPSGPTGSAAPAQPSPPADPNAPADPAPAPGDTAPANPPQAPVDPAPATPPSTGITTDELAFIEAMTAGAGTARGLRSGTTSDLVTVVFALANASGGAFIDHGTVDLSNSTVQAYDQAPNDRLVVRSSGVTRSYMIQEFSGDTSSETSFIVAHDSLKYRAIRDDAFDVQVTSVSTSGGSEHQIDGRLKLSRGMAEVHLVATSGDRFDANAFAQVGGGIVGLSFANITGTVGTINAAGGAIHVLETFNNRIANTVQQIKLDVASTGERNGRRYSFNNAHFQQVERDGFVTEVDFWLARGGLEREGVVIGSCQYDGAVIRGATRPGRALFLNDGTRMSM